MLQLCITGALGPMKIHEQQSNWMWNNDKCFCRHCVRLFSMYVHFRTDGENAFEILESILKKILNQYYIWHNTCFQHKINHIWVNILQYSLDLPFKTYRTGCLEYNDNSGNCPYSLSFCGVICKTLLKFIRTNEDLFAKVIEATARLEILESLRRLVCKASIASKENPLNTHFKY